MVLRRGFSGSNMTEDPNGGRELRLNDTSIGMGKERLDGEGSKTAKSPTEIGVRKATNERVRAWESHQRCSPISVGKKSFPYTTQERETVGKEFCGPAREERGSQPKARSTIAACGKIFLWKERMSKKRGETGQLRKRTLPAPLRSRDPWGEDRRTATGRSDERIYSLFGRTNSSFHKKSRTAIWGRRCRDSKGENGQDWHVGPVTRSSNRRGRQKKSHRPRSSSEGGKKAFEPSGSREKLSGEHELRLPASKLNRRKQKEADSRKEQETGRRVSGGFRPNDLLGARDKKRARREREKKQREEGRYKEGP